MKALTKAFQKIIGNWQINKLVPGENDLEIETQKKKIKLNLFFFEVKKKYQQFYQLMKKENL